MKCYTKYGNSMNSNNDNNDIDKSKKSSTRKIVPKVIIGSVVVCGILCGVFFDKISARYYIMKCNNSISAEEKVTYAAKAVQVDNNDITIELLKNTLINLSENDLDLAEEKLKSLSDILNQNDIRNMLIQIKEKKIDNLCNVSNYEAAMVEFNELDKLGADFKNNKHYDEVMINIASKITGCSIKDDKNVLMEEEAVCFDNFDDDVFDEIVEVKPGKLYENLFEINLYKFIDGKYRLVDTKTISNAKGESIQGIYKYEGEHKGIYISYESTLGKTYATTVYGVDDGRLALEGIVYGNNYTKVEDTNDDGVYEVTSSSVDNILASGKEVIKTYSIHDDGRTPEEISSNKSTEDDCDSSEGYIFPNSDVAYLTEEDLRSVSKEKFEFARNEIIARHGYVFTEEPFKSYFESKSWYNADPNYDGSESSLNEYERANYKVIQSWEKK